MHDLACVVHLHSLYSDGTGTVPEIARAGRRAGADVVLLTDHDTLEAKDRGEEGWYGAVLLLVGTEVSPRRRNHYLAFGIDRVIGHEGLDAAGICRAVADAGGCGVAPHPLFPRLGALPRPGPGHAVRGPGLRGAPRCRAVELRQRHRRGGGKHRRHGPVRGD